VAIDLKVTLNWQKFGVMTQGGVPLRGCVCLSTYTCEDYRAGAGIDLAHDQADAARMLSCPVLVLWSGNGIGRAYDVEQIWAERAPDLRGRALDGGHFLAEERPAETAAELLTFFGEGTA
jgi:pimeloyl-ACP methyl ester carboxylesterase